MCSERRILRYKISTLIPAPIESLLKGNGVAPINFQRRQKFHIFDVHQSRFKWKAPKPRIS